MNTTTAVATVPMAELERYAQAFAQSGMFGTKTKDQALSLLLLAQAEGVHPAIAMRDFDIIQGRPAKKAEAMHRSFIAAGGKIEWHTLTDDKAEATFSHPQGGTARISWDMARARKAGIGGKDMYGKYARQMLRSRVVSEGCRTVYPAATSGLYVPEEVKYFEPRQPQQQPEKDMGAATVIDQDDEALKKVETQGLHAAAQQSGEQASPSSPASPGAAASFITADQAIALEDALREGGRSKDKLLANVSRQYGSKVERLSQIKAEDYADAMEYATTGK